MMTGTEYRQRLQRALDHVENHLESRITLEDLADEAGYSPSHFAWIFRAATGQTPIEYVRRRRMTEAARAILAGDDIVDAVYRFGFSAQDAFTRSFRRAIGLPPGRFRQSGGTDGIYTPALDFQPEGGGKMLNYNLDCDPLKSYLRVQQLLTDEVKELVARIATETMDVRAVDPRTCDELREARVIRVEDDGTVCIDTAVFLEDDLVSIQGVADRWGTNLAQSIIALGEKFPEISPECKRVLIGYNGIDVGVFDLLISEGYAFNHRTTDGRYAGAKIDFYEVCDAYDRFGPYLSGGYGCRGERFAVRIIGNPGISGYLTAGISDADDEQNSFRTNVNNYLTDALGELLLGEVDHPSLVAAAEATGLMKSHKVVVPFITTIEAPAYWNVARLVRDAVGEFLGSTAVEAKAFLTGTLPGRQGVSPDKLIVDLMRYVRMATHKALYESGFYTDSLPQGGNITVFRELAAKIDGK